MPIDKAGQADHARPETDWDHIESERAQQDEDITMTDSLRDAVTIARTIPSRIHDDFGSVVVGGSNVDDQGRWVVGLGLHDAGGGRDIEGLVQGDMFEFAGSMWHVVKVYEPDARPRSPVAELLRASKPSN